MDISLPPTPNQAPRSFRRVPLVGAVASLALLLFPATSVPAQETETLTADGLDEPVEILVDRWGIPHIYAETEHDLFFAQGYYAARDRLFQFEIWRARATGTTAEILGPRAVERDRGARLFRFRGDMTREMNHYHPRGAEIIRAYVDGVNAAIDRALERPEELSLPFRLLGIEPKHWTPEVVVSRHQGLLGNIGEELETARAVCLLGAERVKELEDYRPHEPRLEIEEPVDCEALLESDVLGVYDAFRRPIDFRPGDLVVPEARAEERGDDVAAGAEMRAGGPVASARPPSPLDHESVGSNNWAVSPELAMGEYPLLANDPHRRISAPSLRYWVHLVGPGWNVIGGGEPTIPGVSIGHNEHGAWGLTVFSTDGEDLYVYETDPDDPDRYRYRDGWEEMRVIHDTIPVRGAEPVAVEHRYTRHGPVVYRDEERDLAYAVRPAWMEIGGAPYLASLRMDQATNWEEFREACTYSNIPGENMVWADREGNIGWQAVGIAPIRRGFSGMVPVPGDGRYEWDGYLPIEEKPHELNPGRGYIETSNQNLTPPDYPHLDAIGFSWSSPYRWARASEVLASGRKMDMASMVRLQHDVVSLPARTLVPLLEGLEAEDPRVERARERLLSWDHEMDRRSVAAGIYEAFQGRLQRGIQELVVPEEARDHLWVGMGRTVSFLLSPGEDFASLDGAATVRGAGDPVAGRDAFLLRALREAVADLTEELGPDMEGWVYGQEDYKHARITHPLSPAVNDSLRERLEVGPAPRGGDSYTVNMTSGGGNQRFGATFRILVDTEDWDRTLGMNAPGQAGDPESPLYDNLFDLWAEDRVFPAFFSREEIEGVTRERLELRPGR